MRLIFWQGFRHRVSGTGIIFSSRTCSELGLCTLLIPLLLDIQAPTFDVACPNHINADALRERTTAEVYFQEPNPIDNSGNATIKR